MALNLAADPDGAWQVSHAPCNKPYRGTVLGVHVRPGRRIGIGIGEEFDDMSAHGFWDGILRHRGPVLVATVIVLATVAALLSAMLIGRARELAAGTESSNPPPPPAASVAATSDHSHHGRSVAPTIVPTAEPTSVPTLEPTPQATPVATPAPSAPWVQVAAFGDEDGPTGVMDLAVWRGTVMAIGTTWIDGRPMPRLWHSADGRSWAEGAIDLGGGASPQVIAALPTGGLIVLGTVAGHVDYWSVPERAAAWVSTDGATWTSIALPFGSGSTAGPVGFAAGAQGYIATVGNELWHSVDARSWALAHESRRGTTLYEPVGGDDGWMVKRANASLGTTALLVSGDTVSWHEVDLGNVATIASVAGDWLVSRASDDWQSTEILRSANGLDWSPIVDLDELFPAGSDGTGAAGGAVLVGTAEVTLMSPWRAGHCGFMPGNGWGAWWSTDGATWRAAEIGGDVVITRAADLGDVTVLAGYTASSGEVGFWVSAAS
jgi:hypothetical protein